MRANKILQGDVRNVLRKLPGESVNMVMTSPPYWALRDYGVKGQLGLEPSYEEYINNLCDIFEEVKRLLKEDGTCWVNIGDTYSGSGTPSSSERKNLEVRKIKAGAFPKTKPNWSKLGFPKKCLVMIPLRFAIEMVNRGWILRNIIIWHKPNAMPSSVKDRFTVDFEYLFFFSKNGKYHFEQQREPHKAESIERTKYKWNGHREKGSSYSGLNVKKMCHPDGRNKRCVWDIRTKPSKEAHFAMYPEELCEIPIKAGCPKDGIVLDPFFGSGTTGIVALKQGKNFLGVELNPEYIKIAKRRIKNAIKSSD